MSWVNDTELQYMIENKGNIYTVDMRGTLCPKPVIAAKKAIEEHPNESVCILVDNEVSRDNVRKFGRAKGYDVSVVEDGRDYQVRLQLVGVRDSKADIIDKQKASGDVTITRANQVKEKAFDVQGRSLNLRQQVAVKDGQSSSVNNSSASDIAEDRENSRVNTVSGTGHSLVLANKYLLITKNYLGEGSQELGETLMRTFFECLVEADNQPEAIYFINSGVKLIAEGSPVLEAMQQLQNRGVDIAGCGICLGYYGLKDKVAVGDITNLFVITDTLLDKPVVTL